MLIFFFKMEFKIVLLTSSLFHIFQISKTMSGQPHIVDFISKRVPDRVLFGIQQSML
jgi:hypothetical protein